ncbi:MAG: PQQ-binding-like beta-propeller repeat protein [Myxococcota bacterium]|nr:PQQ-binding-like beta-propeller repeat protein [Myxococcota bacterium]
MSLDRERGDAASEKQMGRMSDAEVLREYVPLGDRRVHGVTFDGKLVWYAGDDELVAFDPEREQVVRRHSVPGANAGTAFDGKHIYQLAGPHIVVVDPADGRIVRRFPAPAKGMNSGMAWADGFLWVGQFRESRILKVDAKTGEVVKTLASDRFVTGVSCVDGALWHAASDDGKPCELRRLGGDGSVRETLRVPVDAISGVEGTREGQFWCGGSKGRLRVVRRKAS